MSNIILGRNEKEFNTKIQPLKERKVKRFITKLKHGEKSGHLGTLNKMLKDRRKKNQHRGSAVARFKAFSQNIAK